MRNVSSVPKMSVCLIFFYVIKHLVKKKQKKTQLCATEAIMLVSPLNEGPDHLATEVTTAQVKPQNVTESISNQTLEILNVF